MIKPLHNNILVKVLKKDKLKTESGIFLPMQQGDPVLTGIVIATGKGAYNNSNILVTPQTKEGDVVIFPSIIGYDIPQIKGAIIIKDSDVLAVLENDKPVEDA